MTAVVVEHVVVVVVAAVNVAAVVEAVVVVVGLSLVPGELHGVGKLHLSWEACHWTKRKPEKVVKDDPPWELGLGST